MRHYETLFVLKPTLTDEEKQQKIDFIKEVITKNGGQIVATEDIGVRKLAYPIQKFERGHYYIIYFTAPSETVREVSSSGSTASPRRSSASSPSSTRPKKISRPGKKWSSGPKNIKLPKRHPPRKPKRNQKSKLCTTE